MVLGKPLERVCSRGCGYEVSSTSAGTYPPARWSFPDECPRCGGDLERP